MRYILITFFLLGNVLFAQQQNVSQFAQFQDALLTQKWDLSVNGIFINDKNSLTIRQFEYQNFEMAQIEVPILLKTKISKKWSTLVGTKLDFYRVPFGMSSQVGVSFSSGFQFEPNKSTYIQGVYSYKVNETDNVYDYNFGNSSSIMLRSGLKF